MKKLGLYCGARNVSGVKAFETWLGQPVSHVLDFIDGSTWSAIENPKWFLDGWKGQGYQLELGIPVIPSSGGSLAAGAHGDYDYHWEALGRNLVIAGFPKVMLRLAWEFNGGWYPWFAGQDPAAFVTYWQRIVTALKKAPGQGFRFDWNPTLGKGNMTNVEAAYPGDAFVSRIGTDVYDSTWTSGDAATRWNTYLTQPYGLNWQVGFATAHGKAMTHPEWGLTDSAHHGGGDNSLFIERMYEWLATHNVTAACYFQHDAGDGSHVLDHFPNAKARFKELFG